MRDPEMVERARVVWSASLIPPGPEMLADFAAAEVARATAVLSAGDMVRIKSSRYTTGAGSFVGRIGKVERVELPSDIDNVRVLVDGATCYYRPGDLEPASVPPTYHAEVAAVWRERAERAEAEVSAIKQAISDPENQPSQFGTVPVAMLQAANRRAARAEAEVARLRAEAKPTPRRAGPDCGGSGVDGCGAGVELQLQHRPAPQHGRCRHRPARRSEGGQVSNVDTKGLRDLLANPAGPELYAQMPLAQTDYGVTDALGGVVVDINPCDADDLMLQRNVLRLMVAATNALPALLDTLDTLRARIATLDSAVAARDARIAHLEGRVKAGEGLLGKAARLLHEPSMYSRDKLDSLVERIDAHLAGGEVAGA